LNPRDPTDVTSPIRTRLRTIERAVRRRPLFEVVPVDVVEREVDKALPKLKPISGAQIRRVGPSQPEGWREMLPKERWKIAEIGLARGHDSYFVIIEGKLAARILVTRASWRDPLFGLNIRLAPNEAYSYGMEAYVPYRRLGAAAVVVEAMLSDLQADGTLERVYGWIDPRNRESQALLRIMFGFTQVQSVRRALLLRRIGWQVPGSDRPSFGPLSRVGHHTGATSSVADA
jgi:RimJ/RimL family protein N-acetyltransferase